MTARILELTRVRYDEPTHLYVVEILSPVHGRWIAQGEWRTKAEADADRRNWM